MPARALAVLALSLVAFAAGASASTSVVVQLRFQRTVALKPSAAWLHADGRYAVAYSGTQPQLGCPEAYWDARRRLPRALSGCPKKTDAAEIGLGRKTIYTIVTRYEGTNVVTTLYAQALGSRVRRELANARTRQGGLGSRLTGLQVDGSLVAFNSYGRASRLWRVASSRARGRVRCPHARRRAAGWCELMAERLDLLAVDTTRLVAQTPDALVLLSRKGRLLQTFRVKVAGIDETLVAGRRLLVRRGEQLSIYDAATGRLRARRRLDGGGTQPALDVQGDLAVYRGTGGIHVLRLPDGRDFRLRAPRETAALDAKLEATGLYYLYARGRGAATLGFMPAAAFRRAVARAG